MQAAVTFTDWLKAQKAKSPSDAQKLQVQIFDAVESPLLAGAADDEPLCHMLDSPDEAVLNSVVMEDDGWVWVRVTRSKTVELKLSELGLPDTDEAEIKDLLTALRDARGRRRTKERTKATR